jgi:XapX domain-containing protein
MKSYAISLGIGLLVGVIYALLKFKSPAPPVIALVGLFGMLAGEQLVPLVTRLIWKPVPVASDSSTTSPPSSSNSAP